MEHYEDTTLQEMKSCKKTKPKVIYYSCDDATVFGDFFAFNMKMATPLDDVFVHANPGNYSTCVNILFKIGDMTAQRFVVFWCNV